VAGQSVATNDLLLVLEAMKMETRVTAPAAGRVKSVNVKAGDSVKLGQVLIEFD
jgi:biotin carboxyl carrier protein